MSRTASQLAAAKRIFQLCGPETRLKYMESNEVRCKTNRRRPLHDRVPLRPARGAAGDSPGRTLAWFVSPTSWRSATPDQRRPPAPAAPTCRPRDACRDASSPATSQARGTSSKSARHGYTPSELYLDLSRRLLREIGDRWERGDISVRGEHAVTAVATRLIGRGGLSVPGPGRRLGNRRRLWSAPGDPHALPVAMLADILRGHSFDVADLGANGPCPSSFVGGSLRTPRRLESALSAVSVSDPEQRAVAGEAARELAARGVAVPILVGGPATTPASRPSSATAGWAPDGEAAAALIERLRREAGR